MSDPQVAINGQANYTQALYLLLQLAVREVIATSKADELLENRAGFTKKIQALAEPQVQLLGLKLLAADLKDLTDFRRSEEVVCPGRKGPQGRRSLWLAEMSSAESGIDAFSPKREL